MKYCRFLSQNAPGDEPSYGLIEERDGEPWITKTLASPWVTTRETGGFVPQKLSGSELLAPVEPSKIICVGRNYRDHAVELGNAVPAEPLLFFKPPSSLLGAGGVIRLPKAAGRIDFEGELAVVIAKRARHLSAQSNLTEYIHGYTLANDVTARELQKKDGQWTRAKGFDTFCPVGPVVDTDFDPGVFSGVGAVIETHVNGQLRQHGSTADFIFSLAELLAYITAAMTLEPGDLLLTGTPAGVGPLADGDQVAVSMAGLIPLSNTVHAEES